MQVVSVVRPSQRKLQTFRVRESGVRFVPFDGVTRTVRPVDVEGVALMETRL